MFHTDNPKVSYYYFSAMYRILNGTNFVERNCGLDMSVCIQSFKYIVKPSTVVYAVWCPSSNDQKVSNYKLTTSNTNAVNAVMVTPIQGNPSGKQTPLTGSNGVFTVNVSELPVFVVVE